MENTIKLKYIWGILLLALHFVFVKGQPICVARQYTVRDGLIQSNPAQILQSHNGFIWVSTWNGVSRFDGRDFETFQFDSLLNQHMQRLENAAAACAGSKENQTEKSRNRTCSGWRMRPTAIYG